MVDVGCRAVLRLQGAAVVVDETPPAAVSTDFTACQTFWQACKPAKFCSTKGSQRILGAAVT